jgi:hypothetical protein
VSDIVFFGENLPGKFFAASSKVLAFYWYFVELGNKV